jgi:hypothetical protein
VFVGELAFFELRAELGVEDFREEILERPS